MDGYDSTDDDSTVISVNSTTTLPELQNIIETFIEAIRNYKKELYDDLPNDESGISQTNAGEEVWESIQKRDASILLTDCSDTLLSKHACKYLKSFFCNNMNLHENINFTKILRENLETFPNSMNPGHSKNLSKNRQ